MITIIQIRADAYEVLAFANFYAISHGRDFVLQAWAYLNQQGDK